MHAIIYQQDKFLTEEAAIKSLRGREEEDSRYGMMVYNRKLVGTTIIETTYQQVYPYQLDDMFHQQMNSMDNKLATGASKRTSRNGYDAGLIDDEEDYDE